MKGSINLNKGILNNQESFNELVFNCYFCKLDSKGDIRSSENCMKHCLQKIEQYEKFDNIKLIFTSKNNQITYPIEQSKEIIDLSKVVNQVYIKLKNDYSFLCDFDKNFREKILNQIFSDPYSFLVFVQSWDKNNKLKKKTSKKMFDSRKTIEKMLLSNSLLGKANLFDSRLKKSSREIYKLLLNPYISSIPSIISIDDSKLEKIDNYNIGPYEISIYHNKETGLNLVFPNSRIYFTPYDSIFRNILERVDAALEKSLSSSFIKSNIIIPIIREKSMYILSSFYPSISKTVKENMSLVVSAELSGFGPIMPFLLDENINEFYIDGPETNLYLDHEKYGRCITSTILSSSLIERIETRLRLESGLRLDSKSPSLKTEIITSYFQVRASIDIEPLAYAGPYLDFRKIKSTKFDLIELIKRKTISIEAASLLHYASLNRLNLVIVGEPNSGKTTLANSLITLTPSHWRKIFLEDTIESISENPEGHHIVRLQVPPFDGKKTDFNKSQEIIKLLHRSPDYLFLGEVQTAEHSQALFHALVAGLSGIQTCHSKSVEDLILRWVYHHKVPKPGLSTAGLIVYMVKDPYIKTSERLVTRISEINPILLKDNLDFDKNISIVNDIFIWSKENKKLVQTCDFNEVFTLNESKAWKLNQNIDHNTEIQEIMNNFRKYLENKLPIHNQVHDSSNTSIIDSNS